MGSNFGYSSTRSIFRLYRGLRLSQTCAVPAVGVDGVLGGLGFVEIVQHQLGSTHKDLAVLVSTQRFRCFQIQHLDGNLRISRHSELLRYSNVELWEQRKGFERVERSRAHTCTFARHAQLESYKAYHGEITKSNTIAVACYLQVTEFIVCQKFHHLLE